MELADVSSMRSMQMACRNDSKRWFPGVADDLKHQTLGLCGEVGELANIVKKQDRGTMSEFELKEHAKGELADILVYLCQVANALHIDLTKEFNVKRVFNEQRFGSERSDRAADPGSERRLPELNPGTAFQG